MALTHADYERRQEESNWTSRFYSTLQLLRSTDKTVVEKAMERLEKLFKEAQENKYPIPKVSDPKVIEILKNLAFKNLSS